MNTAKVNAGFEYHLELIDRHGRVIDREMVLNLMPVEGLNYLLGAGLKSVTPFANWYVGLYEGSYTPDPTDTAALFPSAATELTAYAESQRRTLTLGAIANGAADNQASKAEFTGNTNGKLVMGGFIASAPSKGATTGVLISAVRFNSPKPLDAGSVLRITAGFSITST